MEFIDIQLPKFTLNTGNLVNILLSDPESSIYSRTIELCSFGTTLTHLGQRTF